MEKIVKPWGYEIIWAKTNSYVGKVIVVNAGESLSLQYHQDKEETLYLETGKCQLIMGLSLDNLKTIDMLPGDSFHIIPKTIHRIIAIEDSKLFEVSTPQLDDVVRLEDRYNRDCDRLDRYLPLKQN